MGCLEQEAKVICPKAKTCELARVCDHGTEHGKLILSGINLCNHPVGHCEKCVETTKENENGDKSRT